jgi:hypothetical protein
MGTLKDLIVSLTEDTETYKKILSEESAKKS